MPSAKSPAGLKAVAEQQVRALPDSDAGEDLASTVGLRRKIEAGLADIEAGRVITHEELRFEFETAVRADA